MNKNRFAFSFLACSLIACSISADVARADDFSWPSGDDSEQKTQTDKKAKPASARATSAPALKMETPKKALEGTVKADKQEKAQPVRKRKPLVLYGRLDQIAAEANVTMPSLKAEKATFDKVRPLKGNVNRNRLSAGARSMRLYTGTQQRSFPVDFSGLWGGQLKVWRYNSSSLSDRLDPKESRQMANILRPGKSGNVNFVFREEGTNSIDLEPAKVRLTIPASQSYSYRKMFANNPQMSGMVSKMMANMQVPVILHFGAVSTSGSAQVGISGNQIDQRVVKNVIRRLAPKVVEEQIVTRNRQVIASTGSTKNGYTESVIRFKRLSPTSLYVLAASVDYSGSRKFLRKLIMYGTVHKGVRVNTSAIPQGMGGLSSMLGGHGGAGGLGALGALGGAGGLSTILKSVSGGSGNYGRSNYHSGSAYGGGGNYASMLRNLQRGGGAGSLGSRGQGFGQVIKSLNMITR